MRQTSYNYVKLMGSDTLNRLVFQLCLIMLKMKLYVCRNLCENFRQIGRKNKEVIAYTS